MVNQEVGLPPLRLLWPSFWSHRQRALAVRVLLTMWIWDQGEFSNNFSEDQNLKEVRLFFRNLAVVTLMEVLVIPWIIGRLLYCHGVDDFDLS